MTGKSSLDRSPAAPDAALVHLSGSRRGATEFISGDHIVLSPAPDGGIELSTNDEKPRHSLAVLERRGQAFKLTVIPGAEVRINGERLDELEALAGARERVIASASRSVVFLQGAYGFTESKTGRPLRFAVSPDGSPAIGPGGQPTFTAAGNGPEVEIFYTGTGFVATDDGQITAAGVVYDADTTHGGSGGPVISLDGAVVAINAAILTDFAGSKLGVPAAEALRLIQLPSEVLASTSDWVSSPQ